jgi:predicted nucleic acid-binding protein
MVVIADASPLNYLLLIGHVALLHSLYGEVRIPVGVLEELSRPGAPSIVSQWISNRPSWLTVETDLQTLGKGERQAILLAQNFPTGALLLMDEAKGRRAASRRNIAVLGTLGVLDAAAALGLLDLPAALEKLQATTFYVTPDQLEALRTRDRKRKLQSGA